MKIPTIFYDVTEISQLNRKTGIQRATWEIYQALSDLASLSAWEIVPVIGDASSGHFHRADIDARIETFVAAADKIVITPSPSDVFLGVDLHYKIARSLISRLDHFRTSGCSIFFIVYDILPITHPALFAGNDKWFANEDFLAQFIYWLSSAAAVSNALIAISLTTRRQVETWLETQSIAKKPHLAHFRLGTNPPRYFDTPPTARIADVFGSSQSFLMVGTLEPRKGHLLALEAFNLLWAQGEEARLVIIGKPGWRSENLMHCIACHPRLGTDLFYVDSATDDELAYSYASASTLLSLSEAEGFGLPNIEAASYGLPIVARDIDVFREACGEGAYYVPADLDAAILAQQLQSWKALVAQGNSPSSSHVRLNSWRNSALELLNAMNIAF